MSWKYADFQKWIRDGCDINKIVNILRLSDNKLTTIPVLLSRLPTLYTLDLYKNQLTTLPTRFPL